MQAWRMWSALLFGCMAGISISAEFEQPTAVTPPSHQALAADLAVNADGQMALLWVDRSPMSAPVSAAGDQGGHAGHGQHASQDRHIALTDLYVAISRDGGEHFGEPVKVNASAGAVWGQAVSRPRIVGTSDGAWHVSYAANEPHPKLGKTALTTHYTRSLDGGQTFESPRRLSALTDQDLSDVIHGGFVSAAAFGSIAALDDGSVVVTWIDTRHMAPNSNSGALYVNRSHDSGATFDGEQQLIDSGVCPCCQVMAIDGGAGSVLIGSRAVDSNNFRAATVMRLAQKGMGSERRDIGGAAWQIEGCPLKPTVITRSGQRVFSAVHSGGEPTPGVIFSVSQDGGERFTSLGLVHPQAAVSDAPAIATNGKSVALVWHAKTTSTWAIYYQFFDLEGNALGDVQAIDSPGSARAPVVAARPDGSYQVAWQQNSRIMMMTLSAPTT